MIEPDIDTVMPALRKRFQDPEELGQILEIMYLLTLHYAEGGERPDYHRPAWFLTPD